MKFLLARSTSRDCPDCTGLSWVLACPSCQGCQGGIKSPLEPYNVTFCRNRAATGGAVEMGSHSAQRPLRTALCKTMGRKQLCSAEAEHSEQLHQVSWGRRQASTEEVSQRGGKARARLAPVEAGTGKKDLSHIRKESAPKPWTSCLINKTFMIGMCACACACMCVCTLCMCMHVRACECAHCVSVRVCMCVHSHVLVCVNVRVHVCAHVCVFV